jgi:outer membrane protein assembly factor BamB
MMRKVKTNIAIASIFVSVIGAYVFGAYTVERKLFPYPTVLEQSISAIDFYLNRFAKTKGPPKTKGNVGVTLNEPNTYDGYTFYTPANFKGARLVDMSGKEVHKWHMPFDRAFEKRPKHIASGEPTKGAIWRSATLLPSGSVLAVYAMIGATPYGYGLVKINRDSEVLWRYERHINHLVKVDSKGRVYAHFHKFRNVDEKPVTGNPQLGAQETTQILEDYVAVLSPGGEEIKTFSLLGGIAESEFAPVLELFPSPDDTQIYGEANWDPLHPNNIEVVTPPLAERVEQLEIGDILVSFRTIDAIVGFDRESGKAIWLTRGFWRRQHDPDILENGDLMVFDNRGNAGPGGVSRIVRYEPDTGKPEIVYRGSKQNPFKTVTSGSQHPLPNGNVLVTESNNGRIFEVTSDGQLVWEYIAGTRSARPHVHSAMRVSADWLQFDPEK